MTNGLLQHIIVEESTSIQWVKFHIYLFSRFHWCILVHVHLTDFLAEKVNFTVLLNLITVQMGYSVYLQRNSLTNFKEVMKKVVL